MKIFKILALSFLMVFFAVSAHAQDFGGGSFGKVAAYPGVVAASTSQTLTASQTGQVFVLNKLLGVAPNGAIMSLPKASPKLDYTFIIDAAVYIRIKPQSADIINFSSDVAGSKVRNTSAAVGDSIEVFCVVAGQWSIKNRVGTWATDNNP